MRSYVVDLLDAVEKRGKDAGDPLVRDLTLRVLREVGYNTDLIKGLRLRTEGGPGTILSAVFHFNGCSDWTVVDLAVLN